MLDPAVTEQLRGHLEKVVHPIELVASLDDSPKSTELWTLLEEVAAPVALGDGGASRRRPDRRRACPGLRASAGIGTPVGVGFAGIPMGHEFTSLVLALLQVGGHPPAITDDTKARIESLEAARGRPAVRDLLLALLPELPRRGAGPQRPEHPAARAVHHVAIDGALFQAEVDERQVLAVPAVFANGEPFGQRPHDPRRAARQARPGADDAAAERSTPPIPTTC